MTGRPNIRRRLLDGGVVVGTMAYAFPTPELGRIVAAAGFDWLALDMEHTGWTTETVGRMVTGARGAGVETLVRVPGVERGPLQAVLDLGTGGVMAPMVETVEDAEALVAASRYPPHGRRGGAFGIAHDDYAVPDAAATMRIAEERTLVVALVETPLGIENADAIAAVEGLDCLWLGATDLTSFMGIPGAKTDPRYREAVSRLVAAATGAGKPAGIAVGGREDAERALDDGFRCLLYSGDLWIMLEALREGRRALEAAIESRGAR